MDLKLKTRRYQYQLLFASFSGRYAMKRAALITFTLSIENEDLI